MCDPMTMMAAGGAGLKAFGQLAEGQVSGALGEAQAGMFRANAAVMANQADVAELGAGLAYAKGALQETRVRGKGEQTLATQKNYYASNYSDPAYGSPLLHEALTAAQVESDVQLVRATAGLEASDAITRAANLRVQGATQNANAAISDFKAGWARTSSYIGAASTLLSAGSKMKMPTAGGSSPHDGGDAWDI